MVWATREQGTDGLDDGLRHLLDHEAASVQRLMHQVRRPHAPLSGNVVAESCVSVLLNHGHRHGWLSPFLTVVPVVLDVDPDQGAVVRDAGGAAGLWFQTSKKWPKKASVLALIIAWRRPGGCAVR